MWLRFFMPWGGPLSPQSPAKVYIVGSFVAFIGFLLLIFSIGEVRRVAATRAWPVTSGTLDISEVRDVSERNHPNFKLRVAYHFEVNGAPFHGDRLTPMGSPNDAEEECVARKAAHPAGQACKVSYDPKNPKENCLEPGDTGRAWWLVLLGGVMLVLGSLPVASLFFIPAPKD